MKVRFKYREGEFIRGVRQSLNSRKRLFWDFIWFSLILAYGVFLLVDGRYLFAGMVLIMIPIVYGSSLLWSHLVFPKSIYKKDPSLKEEHSVTFLENEVIYQSGEQVYSYTWDRYSGFKESRDYIFLYIFNKTLTVIPKRIFANPKDQYLLLERLESKLERKDKKWRVTG